MGDLEGAAVWEWQLDCVGWAGVADCEFAGFACFAFGGWAEVAAAACLVDPVGGGRAGDAGFLGDERAGADALALGGAVGGGDLVVEAAGVGAGVGFDQRPAVLDVGADDGGRGLVAGRLSGGGDCVAGG